MENGATLDELISRDADGDETLSESAVKEVRDVLINNLCEYFSSGEPENVEQQRRVKITGFVDFYLKETDLSETFRSIKESLDAPNLDFGH